MATALAALVIYVLSFAVVLLLSGPERTVVGSEAIQALVETLFWGVLAIGSLVVVNRVVFKRRPTVTIAQWAAVGIAVILAGAVQFVLYQWSTARFGSYEIENIGLTALLPATLLAMALFLFASLLSPRSQRRPSELLTIVACGVSASIVITNAPGGFNGVKSESIPLAVALVLAGLFAVVVLFRIFPQMTPDR